MTWLSIVLWLITNLPDLIALIRKLFGNKAVTVAQRESLRVELSRVIRSDATRAEKRRRIRELLD
jgi:hypothetical protein